MNKLCKLMAAGLLAAVAANSADAKVTFWTCGDSTMANYATDGSTPTRGWCQFINTFFQGDIEVINKGKGGQDTHSFMSLDAYWPYIKKNLKAGDYVLLQFAHNDENMQGMDAYKVKEYYLSIGDTENANKITDMRGSVPNGTYIEMLEALVDQIRAAGANPIFASSICRFWFNGNDIKRSGRHDLGDSFSKLTANGVLTGQKVGATDHSMDYTYQMEQLAKKLNVPYIDMMQATRELYLKYGDEASCKAALGNGQDGTHLGVGGAVIIGRLGAQLLKEKGIMAEYINLGDADLSFSPSDGNMGEAYIGNILTSEFTLTGFGLEPTNGNVTVSVTDGFQISTDKAAWSDNVSLAYTSGTLIGTVYVRTSLENPGTVKGTLKAVAGAKSSEMSISAIGTPLPGSGKVTANWTLDGNDSYTLEGDATVVPMKLSGLKAVSHDGGIAVMPESGAWPAGEIDEVYTRYVEFGIEPEAGKTLQINNLSLKLTAQDTDLIQCHVTYSAEPNYANPVTFYAPATMEKGKVNEVSTSALINVPEGGRLLMRVYPWAKEGVENATLKISDVTISGYTANASQPVSLVWTLGKGADDTGIAETASSQFESTSSKVGSDLTVTGSRAFAAGYPTTLYQPVTNNLGDYTDDASVSFTVLPKEGVTFQPKKISFYGTRNGTDGGLIQCTLEYGDKRDILCTGQKCARNNEEVPESHFEFDINGVVIYGEPMTFRIAIASLMNTKQLGFHDVTIEGEVSSSAGSNNNDDPGLVEEVSGEYTVTAIYDLQGRRLAEPANGINIIVKRDALGRQKTEKLILRR